MGRYFRTEALVLGTRAYGESSQRLQLLTRREGLIWVTAQGIFSQRSLTREAANIFSLGTAGLVSGPQNSFHKLTFFNLEKTFFSLTGDWQIYYTALFWKEILLRYQGTLEEIPEIFSLTVQSLQQLKTLSRNRNRIKEILPRLKVQYLYRILSISGYQPDLYHCQVCGKELTPEAPLFFNSSAETVCDRCMAEPGASSLLPPGCRSYLNHSGKRNLDEALTVSMTTDILKRIEVLLCHRLGEITGREFNVPRQNLRMERVS